MQNATNWDYIVSVKLSGYQEFIDRCSKFEYVQNSRGLKSIVKAQGIYVAYIMDKIGRVDGTVGFFFVCRSVDGRSVKPDVKEALNLLRGQYMERYFNIVIPSDARATIAGLWGDRNIGRKLIDEVLSVYEPVV